MELIGSEHGLVMQSLVRLPVAEVKAVQEPVQLLAGEGNHLSAQMGGPVEALFLQALVPQAEAIGLPIQTFHFVPFAIAEHEELVGEWVQLKGTFHQRAETVHRFPHVHGLPTQVDPRQLVRWAHHRRARTKLRTVSAGTPALASTMRPFGKWTRSVEDTRAPV